MNGGMGKKELGASRLSPHSCGCKQEEEIYVLMMKRKGCTYAGASEWVAMVVVVVVMLAALNNCKMPQLTPKACNYDCEFLIDLPLEYKTKIN